jgi:hypothetical protein
VPQRVIPALGSSMSQKISSGVELRGIPMSAAIVGVEILYRFPDTNMSFSRVLDNDAPASHHLAAQSHRCLHQTSARS